jgi:hypothetical protein
MRCEAKHLCSPTRVYFLSFSTRTLCRDNFRNGTSENIRSNASWEYRAWNCTIYFRFLIGPSISSGQGRTEMLKAGGGVGGASMNYSLNFHDYLNKISKAGGAFHNKSQQIFRSRGASRPTRPPLCTPLRQDKPDKKVIFAVISIFELIKMILARKVRRYYLWQLILYICSSWC